MTDLRIGSLFSGYGGLDMAAQAVLGGRVVWHSDIKPASITLLEHIWARFGKPVDVAA